mmetsp:Transcript_76437/g.218920  ORF Transcript_76437/g.218920 Transcript_76437/m.218920 type:complete len:174 (-) Transcript_76437:808-1329(-)
MSPSGEQYSAAERSGLSEDRASERGSSGSLLSAPLNTTATTNATTRNVYKGEAKANAADGYAEGLTIGTDYAGNPEITDTIEMTCQFPKPSFYEIKVENDVISFEDFVVGFAAGDAGDFQITPTAGELNRRGGEPQILSVVFKPNAPGGTRDAWLVVQTEESKWTYHLTGTVM